MANPASITVTALTANAGTNQPAAQTIDTDGTVPITVGGPMDRFILEIINAAANTLQVTIKAGANPPSIGARDLVIQMAATGGGAAKQIVGPFESGRFIKADGSVDVAFLAGASTPNATIRAYRLPKQI